MLPASYSMVRAQVLTLIPDHSVAVTHANFHDVLACNLGNSTTTFAIT